MSRSMIRAGCTSGIGNTASQILILDPETGEATPVDARGGAYPRPLPAVARRLTGRCYGKNGEQWYELYDGKATKIDADPGVAHKPIIADSQSLFYRNFPTGETLKSLDLVNRQITIETADGQTITNSFDYESEGAHVDGPRARHPTARSAAAPPSRCASSATTRARTSGSTVRPTASSTRSRPPSGSSTSAATAAASCCSGTRRSKWIDTVKGDPHCNPLFLTDVTPTIHRPHDLLVHPDGRYVILAGTPGYGWTGGGLLFWDRQAKTGRRSSPTSSSSRTSRS